MKRILNITLILIIVTAATWTWWKFYYTFSDGNRAGMLQKVSHKGNIFKTYEGELVMNNLVVNNTSSVSSEKFLFSVEDEILGKRLMELEGHKVVVSYKEKKGTLPWRGESNYIVDSVRLVE